ncbi:MAG: hypothetical protein KOO62_13295 [candidate division Zixibacteria bacterium]|nr:hypothetical protein [candidate division Zixibacteria bacterium]
MKLINNVLLFTPIMRAAIILLVVSSVALATTGFEPTFQPTMITVEALGEIKIDGDLSDPGWKGVGHASSFVEISPGENIRPEVRTEAFITYDDEHLYIGFICYDNPDEIRATMSQRDEFYGDDVVGVLIDTYGEASWAYELFVNPHGVQKDRLWTMVGGQDSGFDLIWQSAAQVTDSGYTVEFAVPFASMRFPSKDEQTWRVQFRRDRPRDSYYQYTWGANDRNEPCEACKYGTVTGIKNVRPGKGFEILPTVVARQSGFLSPQSAAASFENDDPDAQLALQGKYSISSSMTLEGYYNPDFSQVESDQAQLDVNSTIQLLVFERRPFFQEGADLFRTYFNSFDTRTVETPRYATKFTGRTEKFGIAFMSALDESSPYTVPLEERGEVTDVGESYVNVLRGQRYFGNGSQVGFMLTDRRFDGGGYGSIASLDTRIRLSRTLSVIGQIVGSRTEEPDYFNPFLDSLLDATPSNQVSHVRDSVLGAQELFDDGKHTAVLDGEKFNGHALIAELRRFGRNWSMILDYNEVAPSYRTQTGYDPWNNQRNSFIYGSYTFYPEGTIFQRISPQFNVNARWNYGGQRKWRHATVSLNTSLRVAQTYLEVSFDRGEELWGGIFYDNLWNVRFASNHRLNDKLGFGVNVSTGKGPALSVDVQGDEVALSAFADLKPIDRLTIEPNVRYVKSTYVEDDTELFRQFIGRTRLQLQVNPRLSLRLVVQYNEFEMKYRFNGAEEWPVASLPIYESRQWDVDPLITYRISPFSMFYIGTTHDYRDLNRNSESPSDWKMTERHFFMKLQYLFQT